MTGDALALFYRQVEVWSALDLCCCFGVAFSAKLGHRLDSTCHIIACMRVVADTAVFVFKGRMQGHCRAGLLDCCMALQAKLLGLTPEQSLVSRCMPPVTIKAEPPLHRGMDIYPVEIFFLLGMARVAELALVHFCHAPVGTAMGIMALFTLLFTERLMPGNRFQLLFCIRMALITKLYLVRL